MNNKINQLGAMFKAAFRQTMAEGSTKRSVCLISRASSVTASTSSSHSPIVRSFPGKQGQISKVYCRHLDVMMKWSNVR